MPVATILRKNEPSPPCPPGLEATQGPNAHPPVYVPLNYLDQRTYESDDQGWVFVTYKKKDKKTRKWQGD